MAHVYRGGRLYGTGRPDRLTPHEVRTWAFDPRRRGVDADQVREFQTRLADELAGLHEDVRLLTQENDRLKRALRDWQVMHARKCVPPDDARPNRGRW